MLKYTSKLLFSCNESTQHWSPVQESARWQFKSEAKVGNVTLALQATRKKNTQYQGKLQFTWIGFICMVNVDLKFTSSHDAVPPGVCYLWSTHWHPPSTLQWSCYKRAPAYTPTILSPPSAGVGTLQGFLQIPDFCPTSNSPKRNLNTENTVFWARV